MSKRRTGAVVGIAGLQTLEDGPEVELLCIVRRALWGRGYAAAAARACLDLGFATFELPTIVAIGTSANAASLRVVEKLGTTG